MTRVRILVSIVALASCGGGGSTPTSTPTGPTKPIKATAPAEPTTAEQVMEASIVAQGGREALAKVTSMKMTGDLEVTGIKGKLVTVTTPPRNSLTTIDLPGIGQIINGVHGDFAWEQSAMTGARVLGGPELVSTLRDATFNGDLHWKELFPKSELAGVVDFDGVKAFKVILTSADGESETHYIAKDTKLPIGVEKVSTTQMGKVPISVVQSDFRDVNGMKFAFKALNKSAGQAFTVIVTSVEPNAVIDPKIFEPSDAIKKLAPK
jgi:hypothetical protein